jgi:hypothetical protein
MLPVKLPDASLETIVDAPFEEEAVVYAFPITPEEIEEAFRDVRFAPDPL